MEQIQLSYKDSVINYLRFGAGNRPALCFHGYGEDARAFSFLETHAGTEFTFYSIDLPFHGQTEWRNGLDFSLEDLEAIVQLLLTSEASNGRVVSGPITLIGFSLGGRVSLSLFERMPSMFNRLVLLAPDGLKLNFWYWISTQTMLGKALFHFTMRNPGWFFAMLSVLYKMKIVNSSIFKFVKHYINDRKAREILYSRWIVLRKLRPSLSAIKKRIRMQNVAVRLVYGRHDRIILPVRGEKFRRGIEEQCKISIIHSGHQVLHEKHASEIIPALLH